MYNILGECCISTDFYTSGSNIAMSAALVWRPSSYTKLCWLPDATAAWLAGQKRVL